MVATRLVNLALGLVSIPILIRYLTGTGFAAWALLLALAAGFSLLDLGLSRSAVRFASRAAQAGDARAVRKVFGRVWLLLAASFSGGWLLLSVVAPGLAAWLQLPPTPWLAADDAIVFVLWAVALRAFLQSGTDSLLAAGRFSAVSAVSLLQPMCANVAAMVTAWQFQRLDVTLVAYWSAQLAVLSLNFYLARRLCLPHFGRNTFRLGTLRRFCEFGIASQLDSLAQFASFQFDKLLIASWVGLWAVAPYEVANRAVLALRSLPASAADMQLPTALAQAGSPAGLWQWYQASNRLTAYGVAAFMLAPLAVAPVFLYAWTGEMGYFGRWAFAALSLGAMANVLTLPTVALLQAAGKPGFQARAALLVIALNVPLSLLLVKHWGSTGAAIGTAVALASGSAQLVYLAHRHFAQPIRATLRLLAGFWPLLVVCAAWGGLSLAAFDAWFSTLAPDTRFARANRLVPGLAALGVYALCLLSMFGVEWWRGAISAEEKRRLKRWLAF